MPRVTPVTSVEDMIEHESQARGAQKLYTPEVLWVPGLTPDSQQATRGERCLAGLKQETPS